jgi:hypothetical protein
MASDPRLPAGPAQPPARGEPGAPSRRGSPWGWALAVGVAVGLVGWLAEELSYATFIPPEDLTGDRLGLAIAARRVATELRKTRLALGLLGGALGVGMGGVGGLARHSRSAGLRAAALGGLLGGGIGVGLCWVAPPSRFRYLGDSSNLLPLVLLHAAVGAALGAVGGLAFDLGRGRGRPVLPPLIGGIVGAAGGMIVYQVLGAVALPLARTEMLVPTTWPARLLARLCLAVPAALGVAALSEPRPAPSLPSDLKPPDAEGEASRPAAG